MKSAAMLLSALAFTLALHPGAAARAQSTLEYEVPEGWRARQPESRMRVAEFTLPGVGPESEDAEMAIFYFGGQGGSVEANLERWTNQMEQPDGSSSHGVAATERFDVDGLPVTVIDLTGTYIAEVRPGSGERFDRAGYRLIAAVVETPSGPYFLKLTGPEATVVRWEDSVADFIRSVRHRH